MKRVYNLKIERQPFQRMNFRKLVSPLAKLPSFVDLRPKMPAPYDQGTLGSCTANALCGVMQYDVPALQGSRLFLYYNERKLEHDIPDDAGASLSDGIAVLRKYGLCEEADWPYDITKFAVAPPKLCYAKALKRRAIDVSNIMNDVNAMKTSLVSGFPFVVGIKVYDTFESDEVAKTGLVPMPTEHDKELGGHAVVCVGYDDSRQVWIMRNSWGEAWGDKGYFYLPYTYLLDSSLSSDLWNIKSVSH